MICVRQVVLDKWFPLIHTQISNKSAAPSRKGQWALEGAEIDLGRFSKGPIWKNVPSPWEM